MSTAVACHDDAASSAAPIARAGRVQVVLAGNPNVGKTTLFNALTGAMAKVSNYPGVTVEKHGGAVHLPRTGEIHLIDLPGTYSLNPRSLDEQVAHDVLLGLREDTPVPRAIEPSSQGA